MFKGESAHAAGAPWRGRSALDAVELMDVGWNFRREHLRLATRLHNVITNGGDQPNVVPPNAPRLVLLPRSGLRPHHESVGDRRQHGARPATLMTDTTYTSRLLGSAWPGHFNKPIAEDMYAEHQQGGAAAVVGRGPDAGEGAAEGAEAVRRAGLPTTIPRPRAPRPAAAADADGGGEKAAARSRPAAGRTISATSPGWCRR